ncbi:MAG: MerR family DNA-binding transcriptional regulator [Thermodesulfovibrionales bacterium]
MKRIPISKLHHIKIPQIKRYLTIKEVADLLGVTTLTIRNWDKQGKLKAIRNPINKYRIYKPGDIELFIRKIESQGKIQLG